ncbi:hypothetical protein B0O99DRAFT_690810 [Bisporella sp. PMI_857]|nr:hypothetical protein B0O99DRAFT_690810 [Bisporella sp. PMI_857]
MSTLIVVTIVPNVPTSGSDFQKYLKGLQITAWDRTVRNTSPDLALGEEDVLLGTASGLAVPGTTASGSQTPPVFTVVPGSNPPVYGNSIVQHLQAVITQPPPPLPGLPPPPPITTYLPLAAATALIVVNLDSNTYQEYVNHLNFDVRMSYARVLTPGQPATPVPMPLTIEYNIQPWSTLNANPPASDITGNPNTYDWALGLPTTLYSWLPPPPPSASIASVVLGDASAPPNFFALVAAINLVLAKDSPSTCQSLETMTDPLTVAQCSEIASEIMYERTTDPPPAPQLPNGNGIELFYDTSLNTNTVDGNSGSPTWDQVRQSWETSWSAYHATRDANASRLAQYVFAVQAAVWAELQTKIAPIATIDVVIDPALKPSSSTNLSILLTVPDPSNPPRPILPLVPSFYIPAVYFYALGAKFPMTMSPEDRFKAAVTTPMTTLSTTLQIALNTGILKDPEPPSTMGNPPPPNLSLHLAQATRRMAALSAKFITGHEPTINLIAGSQVTTLIEKWLSDQTITDPNEFVTEFWASQISPPPPATVPPLDDYLYLLLNIIAGGNQSFVNAILSFTVPNTLPTRTVKYTTDLLAIQDTTWNAVFQTDPTLLPSFTAPGNLARRSAAFIVFLRTIFSPAINPGQPVVVNNSSAAILGPASDILQQFINSYSPAGTFTFMGPLNISRVEATLAAAFPGDLVVQNWVRNAVNIISDLLGIVTTASVPANLQVSYMESLYARGFTSVDSLMSVSQAQFIAAMIGTVAYSDASAIYSAIVSNSPTMPEGPGMGFQPVNDGSLVNCVPPLHLSPLGPAQYLSEMLNTEIDTKTLLELVSARRGALGSLAITKANLELQIPLIDLVLESLEFTAASTAAPGAIYGTDPRAIPEHHIGAECSEKIEDLIVAVPQHSSPSLSASQLDAYGTLETCFTSPGLPYSQKLDVCRSYLHRLCTTRFDVMRHFRQDITEYPLLSIQNASLAPTDFNKTVWRLPVEFNIALEYLQISQSEYSALYAGNFQVNMTSTLYGISPSADRNWCRDVLQLPVFLQTTGLSYCEFIELWKCNFVPFGPQANERTGILDTFPDCPPCCLDNIFIRLNVDGDDTQVLLQLILFIRLWRKLHHDCRLSDISFALLADICQVLGLFDSSGAVNPDFVRQLASLLMLVHYFQLPWGFDPRVTSGGAQKTKLLGLWPRSPTAPTAWALDALLGCTERFARHCFECCERDADFIRILKDNLTPLSCLAGFSQTNPWYANPTSTIRFTEVLAKICASDFTVGEIIFLFTNENHLDGDDPFPLPERSESLDMPLNWPEDDSHGIWELREKLLCLEIGDEHCDEWSWNKLVDTMQDLGKKDTASIMAFGEHFFPETLERHGHPVSAKARRWSVPLSTSQTTPMMWHAEPCWPFHYECGEQEPESLEEHSGAVFAGQLWIQLPLRDEDVSRKMRNSRQLRDVEINAVQDLYFAPRAMIAPFALVFSNFDQDISYMIQEPEEHKRFRFFQRQFALFFKRCRVIAEHLACHVGFNCNCVHPSGCCECKKPDIELAWRILQSLIADENFTTDSWEDPSGKLPPPSSFEWDPQFSGSGFAALLGLVGTGLLGKYSVGSTLTWTEMRGGLTAFGRTEDQWSTPVPTIIPSLSAPSTTDPGDLTIFKNGFILRDANGEALDGSQPFSVVWKGLLLVDCRGHYKFRACHPKYDGHPECDQERGEEWIVKIERGQKHWVLLNNHSPGPAAPPFESLQVCLNRGAYTITVEFKQTLPGKDHRKHLKHFRSGFELRYEGPDTKDCLEVVPFRRLIQNWKTDNPLRVPVCDDNSNSALQTNTIIISNTAKQFLELQYISTIRDIRRTYQRAFKAVLLATKFCLSVRRIECDWQSELGFMLDHPHRFRGTSYTLPASGPAITSHVNFNFNFLPVKDYYGPNTPDLRENPSLARQGALFDWWERLFDYTTLRSRVRRRFCREVWLLFEEALQQVHLNQPSSLEQRTEQLLCHLGVRLSVSNLLLTYFATTLKQLTPSDLVDEQWAIRAWYADRYVRAVQEAFFTENPNTGAPYLWASDDPSVSINGDSGNHNLVTLVQQSLLRGKDIPVDIKGVKDINDGLRCRARKALFAYLCGMNRVSLSPLGLTAFVTSPQGLSDLLLQDVEVDLNQRSSRIEDAIHSTQMFVQRARIGLEPGWTHKLSELWECRYCTFSIWSAFKRRQIYNENWLYWDELRKLKKYESINFFMKQLESGDLSVVEDGHPLWWGGGASGPSSDLTQSQELVTLKLQHDSLPEGLSLMGSPMRHSRPTLLTPTPEDWTGESGSPSRNQSFVSNSGSTSNRNTDSNNMPKNPTPRINIESTTSEKITMVKTATGPSVGIETGFASLATIPLWITAAIKMGTQFIRVAAATHGPAVPYEGKDDKDGSCCEKCAKIHDPCMDEYYFWLQDTSIYRYQDVGGSYTGTATSAPSPSAPSPPTSGAVYIQNADIDTSGESTPGAVDPDSDWSDPTKLPNLLTWSTRPMVHLFWTRIHMGTLDPPRRSDEGMLIKIPDLINNPGVTSYVPVITFDGRIEESLYFPVSNTQVGLALNPGIFKYDLATDKATIVTALPTTIPTLSTPPTPSTATTTLDPYPYFIHFSPGKPLFPISGFEVALSIAESFRGKCSWEKALKWGRVAFDPLARDNTWQQCPKARFEASAVSATSSAPEGAFTPVTTPAESDKQLQNTKIRQRGPCCPAAPVELPVAKGRAALMSFLRTLLEWADSLMARNSTEHFQQALVIYDFMHRVLGQCPITVKAHDIIDPPMTIGTFVASPPPLNPELLKFYHDVSDRRRLIHDSVNRRRLPTGRQHHEPAPWFSHTRWDPELEVPACEDELRCFSCCQPYKYAALYAKAIEWVNMVKSLGSSLLSAYEKGDSELLATLRETQQRQILDLGLEVNKNAWRAADWDYQALDRSMESALTNLRYYQGLLKAGLNANENGYVINTGISMGSRIAAQISDGVAQGSAVAPDPYLGGAGVYGTPVSVLTTPGGVKLADVATSAARILNGVAEGATSLAGLLNTEGTWDRREQEWKHQIDVITLEIQQIKRQILSSQRHRATALRELNNHQRQQEHADEVLDFLRDKFTKQELYLFLQQETASLYKQSYSLALKAAKDAQEAFHYERGDTHQNFLRGISWNSLHEGLMAGERLDLALHSMDQAYMNLNCREYELSKNFSLRLHFPLAFLELKACGSCEIEIPEWMFDLDYPSHYMRRIKTLSISVPCVTGPYTGMHCRAQLLSSSIRYKPLLPGASACCCPPKFTAHCGHDPFLIKRYNATEAIAISDAQDDDGLFELNFRDERYLPFEFCGAVSKWRIDLPPENNAFDFDSLTDFIIKLSYTSREGGPELGKMKMGLVKDRVPGNGLRYFDIKHEFQDSWHVFASSPRHKKEKETRFCEKKVEKEDQCAPKRDFDLRFTRNMFPFLTCNRQVIIKRVHIFITTTEHCGDHIRLQYIPTRHLKCCDDEERRNDVLCRLQTKNCGGCGEKCSGEEEKRWAKGCDEGKEGRCCCATVYHGFFEADIGPLENRPRETVRSHVGKLRLPDELEAVSTAYLICEYVAVEKGEKGLCCKKGTERLGIC